MRKGIEVKSIGPLTSWDIFIQGYRRAQQLADDRHALEKMTRVEQWQQTFDYRQQLFQFGKTILVTTATQKIIYASSSLYTMNGYLPSEVVGQTPRIFQGPETQDHVKAYVRESIMAAQPFEASVVNYRKNGSLYDCHINGYPLFDRNNKLVHFIAFESVDKQ